MEYSVVSTKAYRKKCGTDTRVGISTKVGIRASFNKDIFRLF
jgi:hypothetical protein